MSNKSWLLDPTAIKAAKNCILLVQEELGVKLVLSHPEFLEMLKEYVELTDSEALEVAYHDLISFAGLNASHLEPNAKKKSSIVNSDVAEGKASRADDEEYVVYRGKAYKRYQNGLEFKGLYRGQARYA
ncbi:MAG: hypothetical protein HRU21_04290 [Pseudomonadales bacterium]|nr:hypothetical protein [Pseudomonadales bacterium]